MKKNISPFYMKYIKLILSFLSFSYSLQPIPKYPYDPRIHNFGNVGIGGKIHSNLARPITQLIDNLAYNGENIRNNIISRLNTSNIKTISDWCCGVGMSTDALSTHFKNSEIIGVDTSNEMLSIARKYSNKTFILCDAEDVSIDKPLDLITIMFAFHEIPQEGRIKILENAKRSLSKNGNLLIVDIDMSYEPSKFMLSGEPYIQEYLKNVQSDISKIFKNVIETVEIHGHVRSWYCTNC